MRQSILHFVFFPLARLYMKLSPLSSGYIVGRKETWVKTADNRLALIETALL